MVNKEIENNLNSGKIFHIFFIILLIIILIFGFSFGVLIFFKMLRLGELSNLVSNIALLLKSLYFILYVELLINYGVKYIKKINLKLGNIIFTILYSLYSLFGLYLIFITFSNSNKFNTFVFLLLLIGLIITYRGIINIKNNYISKKLKTKL